MFTAPSLLVGLLTASSALAHFTLDYPTTRGFDEDLEPQFCGGFPTPSSPRHSFPLNGSAPIQFTSHHTLATVALLISTDANPTSFNQFSNGQSIPFVQNFFQIDEGSHCFDVDLSSLNLNLTNGSQVTLQMMFNGGDGNLFQCTDLVLLSDYTAPSNETCTLNAATQANATVTATDSVGVTPSTSSAVGSASASASASASGSAASASATKSSKADKMKIGGVMAVVFGLIGAIAIY